MEKKELDLRILKNAQKIVISPLLEARIAELEAVLGIHTKDRSIMNLAVTDYKEIISRQEVCSWILDHIMLKDVIDTTLSEARELPETFPQIGLPFVEYSKALKERETAFWKSVDDLQYVFSRYAKLPQRLTNLFEEIDSNCDLRYQDECDVVSTIISELRRVVAIEGILKFKIDISEWKSNDGDPACLRSIKENGVKNTGSLEDFFCFGTRKFNESLDIPLKLWKRPKWMWYFGKPTARAVNFLQKKLYFRSCRIHSTPDSIACDIAEYLNKWLLEISSLAKHVESMCLTVAYWLDEDGLKIQIIDWEKSYRFYNNLKVDAKHICHPDFGESEDDSKILKFSESLSSMKTKLNCHNYKLKLSNALSQISDRTILIDATRTFKEFCLPYLPAITERYSRQMSAILEWQKIIEASLRDIEFLYNLIYGLKNMSLPICMPDIPTKGNIFMTKDMCPLRIYPEKRIFPFGEISVNGNIVNFTGRNGSGKSTVLLTVFDIQIMTQIGIPVPASEAVVSIKDLFLLSFLERETFESTFRAKLYKDKEIACIIKNLNAKERRTCIVFIDEMGTATTQESVFPVVRPYMDWISKQKVSVVMSTQIPEVSRYIGEKLKGTNLIINSDYQFIPGIGEGEPVEVAREIGFFDVLTT